MADRFGLADFCGTNNFRGMITDERFLKFFNRLMKYEGGYVNDPDDPGGETRYGISKRSYPDEDICNLTQTRAMEIYYLDYYMKLRIPEMKDDRVAWQIFDFGVNAGISRAARMVQRIVGSYPDGVIGEKTLEKINNYSGEYPLHIEFKSERMKYYMMLTEKRTKNMKYLKGWIFRALEL